MNRIPIWIDCDTGVDDAVALLAANQLPELEINGISSVAGNAILDNTYQNTCRVVHLMGRQYPVFRGARAPLNRPLRTAAYFHGEDGLGGVKLPLPSWAAQQTQPAWDAIYAAACRNPGQLRLVAVGPLTNVALALMTYPDLPELLHSIVIMGGAAVGGNVTPSAEFNIYVDPEAAQLVFQSGVPLVMCGLDVTLQAYLTQEDLEEIAAIGTPVGTFVYDCLQRPWALCRQRGLPGVSMHDSVPVFYVARPELFQARPAGVYVETRGKITLGKTVTDLDTDKKFPQQNAMVVLQADRPSFISQLKDCLRRY